MNGVSGIDQFSKSEFDNSLADLPHVELGIIRGEYCYEVPLNDAKILIRSSIGPDGVAADTGLDSIRVFLMSKNGDFIISDKAKIMDWVTRVSGWDVRMHERIENLIGILSQIPTCKVCGELCHVNMVTKPDSKFRGKLFASCSNRTHEMWKIVRPDAKMSYGEYMDGKNKEIVPAPSKIISTTPLAVKTEFVRPNLDRLNSYQLEIVKNMG